jgi:hypothetical protein
MLELEELHRGREGRSWRVKVSIHQQPTTGGVGDGNPTGCARLKARPFLAFLFLVFPRFQLPVIREWWYVLLTLRDKRVIW